MESLESVNQLTLKLFLFKTKSSNDFTNWSENLKVKFF